MDASHPLDARLSDVARWFDERDCHTSHEPQMLAYANTCWLAAWRLRGLSLVMEAAEALRVEQRAYMALRERGAERETQGGRVAAAAERLDAALQAVLPEAGRSPLLGEQPDGPSAGKPE